MITLGQKSRSKHPAFMGNMPNNIVTCLFFLSIHCEVHCLSFFCGMWSMRIVPIDLVVLGGNGLIVKTSRDIVWSESLLLGTSVMGSSTEK